MEDYEVKDANAKLGSERWQNGAGYGGRGWMSGERLASTYDLVEQMFYLYVRVAKAKDLPPSAVTGSCDPYDKEMVGKDDYLGRVNFDLNEIRIESPPDSPSGSSMMKLFPDAWHSDAAYVHGVGVSSTRSKVYVTPKLWIHLRVCLEGGYHVMDESTLYISDPRPTARQLWKQPVGILEVGVLEVGADQKRFSTTLVQIGTSSTHGKFMILAPLLTLGVFDNCHLGIERPGVSTVRDSRIGKVRIRISTLEAHRVYMHSYPLLVLHPTGIKKMGELQLAIRFTSLSLANMIHVKLGRAEPPLRKEVVEYMLDVDSHMWSMRRSKANFFRIMSLLSGMISVSGWLGMFATGRIPSPQFSSCSLSHTHLVATKAPTSNGELGYPGQKAAHPDELDEEFDTFPPPAA
ncbi:unnamed protein product [Thlaspi arvense]|uniref:C2 domain-containing protein n=1 Tax=Thlaspi arvense TaxID=13288 RepID=A0AAU9RUJ0_THLAR|nr:unnamed protein product [Thlaspi arvense]